MLGWRLLHDPVQNFLVLIVQLTHCLISLVFFHLFDIEVHLRNVSWNLLRRVPRSKENFSFFIRISATLLFFILFAIHDVLDLVEEHSVFIFDFAVSLVLIPLERAFLHVEHMRPVLAQVNLVIDGPDVLPVHLVIMVVRDSVNQFAGSLVLNVRSFTRLHFIS